MKPISTWSPRELIKGKPFWKNHENCVFLCKKAIFISSEIAKLHCTEDMEGVRFCHKLEISESSKVYEMTEICGKNEALPCPLYSVTLQSDFIYEEEFGLCDGTVSSRGVVRSCHICDWEILL